MNLQPVIALCGRPNVGKSTLFNRLVRDRTALVADVAGLTRDRIYGAGKVGDKPYMVVDTGGLVSGKGETVQQLSALQVTKAIREADAVLVIVDTRAGLTTEDEHIAARIRQFGKPMFLVANKTEGLPAEQACAEFHGLGLGTV
jgi:GTP-binding protein